MPSCPKVFYYHNNNNNLLTSASRAKLPVDEKGQYTDAQQKHDKQNKHKKHDLCDNNNNNNNNSNNAVTVRAEQKGWSAGQLPWNPISKG